MLMSIRICSIFGAAESALGGIAAAAAHAKSGASNGGKIHRLTSSAATMPRGEKKEFNPAKDFEEVDPVDEFTLDEHIDGGSDDEEIVDDFDGIESPVSVPQRVRRLGESFR